MKLSEYKNEDALDLLADLLEPTAKIFSDKELAEVVRNKGNKITACKVALKNNKKSILEILARLENVPVDKYECNIATVISKLLEIINDEVLADFFTSQSQQMVETSSGKATANTEEEKK